MGYPEDNLSGDERILLHAHPHWKALIGPALLFVVASAAAVALLAWSSGLEGTLGTVVTWVTIVAWLVVGIGWGLIPFARWFATHFVITDRRVMYRTGIIARNGIDIPVARINTVQFRHGIIDRMFKTGTLIIESASDDPLEFEDIPNVEAVHKMLYDELYDELHDEGKS